MFTWLQEDSSFMWRTDMFRMNVVTLAPEATMLENLDPAPRVPFPFSPQINSMICVYHEQQRVRKWETHFDAYRYRNITSPAAGVIAFTST